MTITNKLSNPSVKPAGEVFNVYYSARPGIRLITESGFAITFSGYKYVTQNESAIAYLDNLAATGAAGISVEGTVTSEDLDPETALRKKYFAEFTAELAKTNSDSRDLGSTEGAVKLGGVTSKDTPK